MNALSQSNTQHFTGFRNMLTELFEREFEWKWIRRNKNKKSYIARFNIQKGINCFVFFVGYDDTPIENEWALRFTVEYRGGRDSSSLTQGEVFRIYGTVISVVKSFVSQINPARVHVMWDDNTKKRIYEILIKRYASKYGYEVKALKTKVSKAEKRFAKTMGIELPKDTLSSEKFVLTRKDISVTS